MSARVWLILLSLVPLACSNGVGELCATNRPCVEALRCVYPSEEATTGICDYPLREFGDRCQLAAECEEELTCSSHFTLGDRYGTCIHRREEGEPCTVDRDCRDGRCVPPPEGALLGMCGQ